MAKESSDYQSFSAGATDLALGFESRTNFPIWAPQRKVVARHLVEQTGETIEESITEWTAGLEEVYTHVTGYDAKSYSPTELSALLRTKKIAEDQYQQLSPDNQDRYRFYYLMDKNGLQLPEEVDLSLYKPYLEQRYLQARYNNPMPAKKK